LFTEIIPLRFFFCKKRLKIPTSMPLTTNSKVRAKLFFSFHLHNILYSEEDGMTQVNSGKKIISSKSIIVDFTSFFFLQI
jgi:hypothetical protein